MCECNVCVSVRLNIKKPSACTISHGMTCAFSLAVFFRSFFHFVEHATGDDKLT